MKATVTRETPKPQPLPKIQTVTQTLTIEEAKLLRTLVGDIMYGPNGGDSLVFNDHAPGNPGHGESSRELRRFVTLVYNTLTDSGVSR